MRHEWLWTGWGKTCIKFLIFNDTATTEIYTLSLHDALPISRLLWSWSRKALNQCLISSSCCAIVGWAKTLNKCMQVSGGVIFRITHNNVMITVTDRRHCSWCIYSWPTASNFKNLFLRIAEGTQFAWFMYLKVHNHNIEDRRWNAAPKKTYLKV